MALQGREDLPPLIRIDETRDVVRADQSARRLGL